MRKRTRARELALQFLYQVDLCGEDTLAQANDFLTNETKDHDVLRFAGELVRGTWEYRNTADELIRNIAKNWDIGRMAVLDRNILRMAVFEMRTGRGTPPKVVINEAIELGKRFSTQHSGKFINGILDRAKDALQESEKTNKKARVAKEAAESNLDAEEEAGSHHEEPEDESAAGDAPDDSRAVPAD